MGKISYVEDTRPIKQVRADNGKGYHDNVVFKLKSGKAVGISDKFGNNLVKINVTKLDAFIADLQLVAKRGTPTSTTAIEYEAA